MTTWYLIIILIKGVHGNASQQTIEFQNEDACIAVMETLTEKYDHPENTIICVRDK